MKFSKIVIFLIIVSISLSCSCYQYLSNLLDPDNVTGVIDADHTKIQYVGRFDHSDPKNVVFDWPGVYIRAIFQGTSCSIRLEDNSNYYNVIIDNGEPQVIKPDTSTVKQVATGLTDTEHSILIAKRTESFVGKGVFRGFIIDTDKKLVTPGDATERRIEFIGNSITCGYGAEGKSANENFKHETENATVTYAALVSKAVNADYQVAAYSGKGVVRNYGDANKTSPEPMPSLYDRTLCSQAAPVWDFSSWVPQAVVINLGTNDFSTNPHPDKDVFQNAYKDLIDRVRSNYAGVTVFCICGPMIGGDCATYINEVVQEYQSNNHSVYYIPVSNSIMTMADWGSDWHPNIQGHQKIANIVLPKIQEKMNW